MWFVLRRQKKKSFYANFVISDRFLEQTGLHVTKSPFALKKNGSKWARKIFRIWPINSWVLNFLEHFLGINKVWEDSRRRMKALIA